jgi:hypothetical protein
MHPTLACDLAFLHVHNRLETMRRVAGETRLNHQVQTSSRKQSFRLELKVPA